MKNVTLVLSSMQSYSMKCLCKAISSCNVKINTLSPGSPRGDPRWAGLIWSFLLPGGFAKGSGFARNLEVPGGCFAVEGSGEAYWALGWRKLGRVCFVMKEIGQDCPVTPRVTHLCGLRTCYLDNSLRLSICCYSRNRSYSGFASSWQPAMLGSGRVLATQGSVHRWDFWRVNRQAGGPSSGLSLPGNEASVLHFSPIMVYNVVLFPSGSFCYANLKSCFAVALFLAGPGSIVPFCISGFY